MISRVESFVLQGIDAVPCEVEADIASSGLPKTLIVGLPDTAVRESLQRVRTALQNSGYRYPQTRVTVNLAPANLRKEGPVYDLPIALAILEADGTIGSPEDGAPRVRDYLVAGELALDGRVRPVRGGISLALLARKLGRRGVIVPRENAEEAAAVGGIDVLGVSTVGEVVEFLGGTATISAHAPIDAESLIAQEPAAVDFGDVRGQEAAKRALTVAAAGGHNALLIGPAGTGETVALGAVRDECPSA